MIETLKQFLSDPDSFAVDDLSIDEDGNNNGAECAETNPQRLIGRLARAASEAASDPDAIRQCVTLCRQLLDFYVDLLSTCSGG